MGTPEAEKGHTEFEGPLHRVRLTRPFYLGMYEVTQAEYECIMKENPSHFRVVEGEDTTRFPIDSISWTMAVAYCDALSALESERNVGRRYRLPTEAEWEYACRAERTTPVAFGRSLSSAQANFDGFHPYGGAQRGSYLQRPTTVGAYPANDFGLFDMHGNVYEWCADWYEPHYYRSSPFEDPPGPPRPDRTPEKVYRVLRGGSWNTMGLLCRSGQRFMDPPGRAYPDYGLRVACEVEEKS